MKNRRAFNARTHAHTRQVKPGQFVLPDVHFMLFYLLPWDSLSCAVEMHSACVLGEQWGMGVRERERERVEKMKLENEKMVELMQPFQVSVNWIV